ncbi:MAG: alcohol dehydrogenase catalytic domain-containing protein [Chloroflexota bacterium]|nr:alcohol dehydrogenase catalytic domain-containing protein [Chloroflexota bacterium]
MRAVVIDGPGEAHLTELDPPVPGPDEVLIRSFAAGICGSDVELYQGTRPAEYVRYPVVPGHEWAGRVESVGERVRGVQPGDKVVSEGFVYCGSCEHCHNGLTNLCEAGYNEVGFTRPGGFAEYVAVPSRLVHRLPADADLSHAALLEPTAVVADSFLRAPLRPGSTVVVIGDGAIGQLAVHLARLHSPAVLVLVGSRDDRLHLGLRMGATHTLNYHRDDVPARVRELTDGRGANFVFEGAGKARAVEQAFALSRRSGTIALQGIAGEGARLPLDPDLFALKHLTVLGTFGANSAAWTYAVRLFSAGLLELGPLVTHRYALPQFQDALDTLVSKQPGTLKVLVTHEGT